MKQWQKHLSSVQSGFQVSLKATLLRVICFLQWLHLGQDTKSAKFNHCWLTSLFSLKVTEMKTNPKSRNLDSQTLVGLPYLRIHLLSHCLPAALRSYRFQAYGILHTWKCSNMAPQCIAYLMLLHLLSGKCYSYSLFSLLKCKKCWHRRPLLL